MFESTDHNTTDPWYKQFWPWFIIALPLTAVIASVTTVIIAFTNADTVVRGNWYKDGLAINQRLDKSMETKKRDIKGQLKINRDTGQITVKLQNVNSQEEPSIHLQIIHPTQVKKDINLSMLATGDGEYQSKLAKIPEGNYYIQIEPASGHWQLNSQLNFAPNFATAQVVPQ